MTRQPFENLKFRIHNIPKSADLFEEFPELQKHQKELKSPTQPNEVLRYLIYLYDPKSDLLKEEPYLDERKKKARELAGLSVNHGIDKLEDMAFYFMTRVINDRKFREWQILQKELEENHKARWSDIDDEETKDEKGRMEAYAKKGPLRIQAMEIQKQIDSIEEEIFGDNDDVKKKANEFLLTTPEKVANAYAA